MFAYKSFSMLVLYCKVPYKYFVISMIYKMCDMYRWLLLYVAHWLIDCLLLNTHEYHVLICILDTREGVLHTTDTKSLCRRPFKIRFK